MRNFSTWSLSSSILKINTIRYFFWSKERRKGGREEGRKKGRVLTNFENLNDLNRKNDQHYFFSPQSAFEPFLKQNKCLFWPYDSISPMTEESNFQILICASASGTYSCTYINMTYKYVQFFLRFKMQMPHNFLIRGDAIALQDYDVSIYLYLNTSPFNRHNIIHDRIAVMIEKITW